MGITRRTGEGGRTAAGGVGRRGNDARPGPVLGGGLSNEVGELRLDSLGFDTLEVQHPRTVASARGARLGSESVISIGL